MATAATATVLSFVAKAEALPSGLSVLIEAHRVACDAFRAAIDHQNAIEEAFEEQSEKEPIVSTSIGVAFSMYLGADHIKARLAEEYAAERRRLKTLSRVDPDLATRASAVFEDRERSDMDGIDRAFADADAKREAFGLVEAERRWEGAEQAETAAAIAVCAYRCRDQDEARLKGEYLRTSAIRDEFRGDHVQALLASMVA